VNALTILLGLPYAVAEAGLITGIILLFVLCVVTDWTIRLIVINAKMSGRTSYIDIMNHCFGTSGRAAVSFFQFIFAFGGASLFLSRSRSRPIEVLQVCVPLG
jgi:sodium-coupled neutral amino acid transporter 11